MDPSIVKHDNFVDEELNTSLQAFFENTEWKYGEKSIINSMKETLPHWSKYFYMDHSRKGVPIDEVVFEDPCIQQLYEKIKAHIAEHTPDMEAKLLRCYANGHTCGNDANIHYDDSREGTFTYIFYPIKTWNVDWGGETIFWDRTQREIVQSVIPKSNRLLVFPSNLWHGARPVSRYCSSLRITLMFKFILTKLE
jgi:SM-20-related protein